MDFEEQDLSPSGDIFQKIFGEDKPAELNILAQTFHSCTFSVHVSETSASCPSKDLLVRLGLSSGRLPSVAKLQQVARLCIPELIPKLFDVGTATTTDGRKVEYSVTQFISGTIGLESVWQDLDDDQQLTLMNSVVDFMKRIQRLTLDNKTVQTALSTTAFVSEAADGTNTQHELGGPELGYSKDTTASLASIIEANGPDSPTSSIQRCPSGDGITIASAYEDLGSVHIRQSDLEFLQQHAVLCHNDLEPRNILVRPVKASDGKKAYELAAIIDWEMAGFYPFAYEYCLKDSVLGSSNLYFSWYTLFKQRTVSLLPAHPSTEALIRAVDLIDASQRKQMTSNVGELVREKWIEREKLERGPSVRDGWVRRADAGTVPSFTKEDEQELLEEVLRALGRL